MSRLSRREVERQLVHFGSSAVVFALPWLGQVVAVCICGGAIAMNVVVLPRLPFTRRLFRDEESLFGGIVLYPTVIMLLMLLLPGYPGLVAGAWGVLAAGDAASGLVGRAWGRHPIPGAGAKTWEGFAAFLVAGLSWALVLMVWCGVEPGTALVLAAAATVAAAVVEILPLPVDDNVTVGATAGIVLYGTAWLLGSELIA